VLQSNSELWIYCKVATFIGTPQNSQKSPKFANFIKILAILNFLQKVRTPRHLSSQSKAELTNPLATTHFKRFSKIQKNSKMRSAMQNFCIKNASYSQSSDKFLAAHADDSATQHARKSRKNQKILFPLRQVANITNLGQHQRYYYKEISL
jgi:hypothetical protein